MPPLLPNEVPTQKINDLSQELTTLKNKVLQLEQFLEQYQPQNIVVQDINGKLKPYSALAKANGAVSNFLSGLPFEIKDVSEKENEHKAQLFYASFIKPQINQADTFIDIQGIDDKFDVRANDWFYIELTFDPASDKEPTAKLKKESSLWSAFPEVVEYNDDGDQTSAYIAVAKITTKEQGQSYEEIYGVDIGENLMATSYLRSNLVLLNCCVDGRAARYPFPDGAAPIISA